MRSAVPLPSYAEVEAELPRVLDGEVTERHLDYNGHVNMRHYVKFAAVSSDRLLREVGIDDDYRADRRMGTFTAEHHVRYLAELHVGDHWAARTVWLDRSAKAAHQLSFVLNETSGRLSACVEMLLVHVGMDSRRATAFPDDVAERIDALIARTRTIPWPLPLGGALSVGRSAAQPVVTNQPRQRPEWLASSPDLADPRVPVHARRIGEDRTSCGEDAATWRFRWRPAFDPIGDLSCATCRARVWQSPGFSVL